MLARCVGVHRMQHDQIPTSGGTVPNRRRSMKTRRELLRSAAVSGTVLTVGSAVVRLGDALGSVVPAFAATLDDQGLAAFAASLELTAIEAYQRASATGMLK